MNATNRRKTEREDKGDASMGYFVERVKRERAQASALVLTSLDDAASRQLVVKMKEERKVYLAERERERARETEGEKANYDGEGNRGKGR